MTKHTKETKDKIKEYFLNAISTEGYSQMIQITNEKEELQFVFDTFKSEYGHEIHIKGEFKAFSSWLSGLPGCVNIDFDNYKILELAKEWGQELKTPSQEDKIINQWWDFAANQYFKLFKHYKVVK